MFRKVVATQILLLQIFASGCAYLNAQRDDVNSLITKWITEQEFDKATNTLSQVKSTHPQYLQLMLRKNEISDKSNKFVTVSIKQAQFFIKNNKWEDAYTVYNFVINKVSENKKLNLSYKSYLQKRSIYVNNLKYKLLIINAKRLIKNIPIQAKIAAAVKEVSAEQKQLEQLQNQAANAINLLIKYSSNALKQKNTSRAATCIQLAEKLQPTKKLISTLKQHQRKISSLTAGKKHKKQQAESNTQIKLLKQFNAAFDKNDLVTAKKKLAKLFVENKNNYELTKLKLKLDLAITKKMKLGIETGRILYTKGRIKLALEKWLRLKKLTPDNIELLSHISRAERVLRKLKTLTSKDKK